MTPPPVPILYSFRRCPYAMRARLALAVSGTRHELREVKLSAKPDAMLAASPKGTVPVLVLPDGTVIDESLAIMRHALAQRDPEGWLDRDDPALIARNDGAFKHDLDRYKYPERSGSVAVEHRQRALDFVREIDERLADGGQLGGGARGLADAAIMPFIRQFVAVDAGWFETQRLARVETWLAGHLASDLFAAIMRRAPVWAPGNAPVLVGA
ncbi:glutathione S-transferase N-terminal domain-containing protein [Sphingomonas sp. S1-29]|uniref:glutathione S-transferase N-terminal domain-containing protein n=1 Tax=Sphingomonas sp. S1-29 TaxID=2991074 RepID=UPI0022400898|nr:glutathione S-transferase N-terminal domain-containing protein [Sphingomonas sp. S1-29]UZK69930.1 glutathione S-transferase N-terminal domain-containing protein [Sphingomonas sp. S1-29]